METYNAETANKAQREYCNKNNYPHFAPTQFCYSCHNDIYAKIKMPHKPFETGISVESAGNHLITGCPHCNYSFCE